MERPRTEGLRGKWRRALFAAWIGASALVAIYVAIAAPWASGVGEGRALVALVSPALMIFLLATGLGWLVLLAISRPGKAPSKSAKDGPARG